MDFTGLRDQLRLFASEREWDQFHTPKNLAISVTVEAAELLEAFQWRSDVEVAEMLADPAGSRAVADELADVLIYLVRLADVTGIDLGQAIQTKIRSNAERYAAKDVRGSAEKRP